MPSTPSFVTIVGLKKSGKTTVTAALITELTRRGLRVASVKSMRHGAFDLEPEGADTRRHLAAGAEATLAFAADEEAVFARRSPGGPRDRLEHWLPPEIDWVVCEGGLEGMPADRVVLCLERVGDMVEALAVRKIAPGAVIAVSGIAADAARGKDPSPRLPVPLLDATDPVELSRLADLVLAR
jgi:molybdopterin-guanine dinucleotide biosynthesis protein MobB